MLLGHELYHLFSNADQARIAIFFRQNTDTKSEKFKKYKAEITDLYSKQYAGEGRTFTEQDFWNEFAAENCETLFTNKDYINKLCQKSRSPEMQAKNALKNYIRSKTK